MPAELTQRDLKQAKEELKRFSREKCRIFLDGTHNSRVLFIIFQPFITARKGIPFIYGIVERSSLKPIIALKPSKVL